MNWLLTIAVLVASVGQVQAEILTGGVVIASNSTGADPGFGSGVWTTSTQDNSKLAEHRSAKVRRSTRK
jgi:hypothetical protein